MPAPELFMKCPFCREKRANFSLAGMKSTTSKTLGLLDPRVNARAIGTCYLCSNEMLVFFEAIETVTTNGTLSQAIAKFNDSTQRQGEYLSCLGWLFKPIQTAPERPTTETPEGLPEAIEDVMNEAITCMDSMAWRSAITTYGTAIDFACDEFLKEAGPGMTIGKKLKKLSDEGSIPKQLVDLSTAVNLDRIAAVHYRDKPTEEQAQAVQTLTTLIVEYLFTLPGQIREAEERLARARSGNTTELKN